MSTAAAPTRPPVAPAGRWTGLGPKYGALAALLVLVVANAIFTRNFATADTFWVVLLQVSTVLLVAIGMTLVIATGGIDLSVGSLMAIAGALAPLIFMGTLFPLPHPMVGVGLAFVLPVLAAGAFGWFNGWLVTRFRIQPIIATLVLFIAGRGIAQVLTEGKLQVFRDVSAIETYQFIGMGRVFGIPFQVILMLVIVAVAAWAMRSTIFGRYILAVGGNERAARLAGVPVNRVKLAVYAISGACAGVAGLIVIMLNSSSDANQVGLNMELDAIAAVAVGGTPLTGGHVTIVGTLIGACIMQLIRFTLLAHGVPEAAALVVKGAIIVAAVYVQRQHDT